MRNCGFIYKEGENKFRSYVGQYKVLNCPISLITNYSNQQINQYSTYKTLNSFGGTFNIDSHSNKEIESLSLVNTIVTQYENDKADKENKKQLREAKRKHG